MVAHLRAWQQISVARLEAALNNKEPEFPDWLQGYAPESEDQLEQFNARINDASHVRPWPQVHHDWQTGFWRFIELVKTISEEDLFDAKRYPWLNGYRLSDVLLGSYNHHHERIEPWLT